ncbi:MAG: hypothetical protein ACO1RX_22435 [Candidatus Sericytochromatia bacterium]
MRHTLRSVLALVATTLAVSACDKLPNYNNIDGPQPSSMPSGAPTPVPSSMPSGMPSSMPAGSDGPGITVNPHPHLGGNAMSGQEVFRFETFGNEKFWTDAARLPQGIVAAGLTPVQALQAGLHVDVEALSPEIVAVVAQELKTDLSPANAPALNDPATTVALINANAVLGVVPKDTNGDGELNVMAGDKVGVSCALCHSVTDRSVFNLQAGGSIGKRVDGPAMTTLNVGAILALAANTRAFYPNAQLASSGNVGRAPSGLTRNSSEAEFDAYFSNPAYYPVGTFDDTVDGNGNSVKNPPLFEQDLAAPYGSAGEISKLDDFSNVVYTVLFDPTSLTTPEGRAFLQARAGAAGTQLADDYAAVLAETQVTGYPFVTAQATGRVAESSLTGRRVDEAKLLDMNAYLDALKAPIGAEVDANSAMRGRQLFRTNCTQCHNVNQAVFVPPTLTPLETVWPGYQPMEVGPRGDTTLSPILNAPGTFDDKLIIVDASPRERRGNALPLLLDLAPPANRSFLHDASVPSLDNLLDPSRGASAPHPFYVANPADRTDMVNFLKSLDSER